MRQFFLTVAVLSLFLTVSPSSHARLMCVDIHHEKRTQKFFSAKGPQIFRSANREVVYDYKPGRRKAVWLVIHGLGDNMVMVEGLTARAEKDGFGVLRVDLHGHGLTLENFMRKNPDGLPLELSYAHNIHDIRALLEHLRITDLVIVGHSYGGGIAYGLSAELAQSSSAIRVHSVHVLAPYVQRIDKFFRSYFSSPDFLVRSTEEAFAKMGLSGAIVRTIWNPFFRFVKAVTANIKAYQDNVASMMKLEQTADMMLDPMMENFMEKAYRNYFVLLTGKSSSQLTPQEEKEIDIKVKASILVTKGIRSFDLLDHSTLLPRSKAPVQVIGGKGDQLVIPAQLEEFDQRLKSAHIPHQLTFLEGEKSHHLFPRTMTDEVYQRITSFLGTRSLFVSQRGSSF